MLSSNLDKWLDSIVGMCRFCDKPLGESPPPACASCTVQENRRITRIREANPYKKVWDTVEDAEAVLLEWVKNGTLFAPTWEELAHRHISKSRYLLNKARSFGKSAEGYSAFNEAMSHRDKAEEMLKKHQEVLRKSR
jgi:hypothetical protein